MWIRDTITSRKNPRVIYVASLSERKYREEHGVFAANGIKLFSEAADARLPICEVYYDDTRRDTLLPLIEEKLSQDIYADTEIFPLSASCFEKISSEKSPEGVITVVKHLDFLKKCTIINSISDFVAPTERVILLYAMRDPGNLGAVVRSAVAFGADHIIVSADSADIYHPKTLRAAMGSLFRVKVTAVQDLGAAVVDLRKTGRRIFAAELSENAIPFSEASMTARDAVIIGNEGHGIPKKLSLVCDGSVYIPISKATESLNASVAAALFMWEQSKL